jgi:hypothetical protein
MSVSDRYRLGALLYVPATSVTSLANVHRKFGDKPKLVWLPGFVNDCAIIISATGRKQKYVTSNWCYGNGDFKTKQIALSQTRLQAPDGTRIPLDVQLIEESLLWRPPPKKKAKDGEDVEDGVEDGEGETPASQVPMSQLFDLPTDEAFASLPSPTTGNGPTASLDCVELEVDWKEDDDATLAMVNGRTLPRAGVSGTPLVKCTQTVPIVRITCRVWSTSF